MSFDARSRERLEALGRSLPQPLPQPQPPGKADAGGDAAPAGTNAARQVRHRVELEQNPEALFRELMQVSPDGTVPPHLLARLRDLEARPHAPAPDLDQATSSASPPPRRPGPVRQPIRSAARNGDGIGSGELYTQFQQLLLEEEDAP